jgi:serine/threonine protein kinase
MVGFKVGNPSHISSTSSQDASVAARQTLQGYQAHLQKRDGTIKAGVLRIKNNKEGETSIYRDRAYHLSSRANTAVRGAGELTRNLFKEAYEQRLAPAAYTKLMGGLEGYLEARGNQMGTKSFNNFFKAFESAVNRQDALAAHANSLAQNMDMPVKLTDEALRDLLGRPNNEALSTVEISTPQSRQAERNNDEFSIVHHGGQKKTEDQIKSGLAGAFGVSRDAIGKLGQGTSSVAFQVTKAGKPETAVVVPLAFSETLTDEAFGKGELSAAAARTSMRHVSKPTEFILRVSLPVNHQLSHRTTDSKNFSVSGTYDQAFRVPADKVREFFNGMTSLSPGEPAPEISIEAVGMPAGPSTTLGAVMKERPLNANEFRSFASGFFAGVSEMNEAELVHHDLKPDNVVFDRAGGRVMVIDMGGTVSLGPDGKTRQMPSYNPLTRHPAVKNEEPLLFTPHGKEFDRYSYAVTLLTALSTDFFRSAGAAALRKAFEADAGRAPVDSLLTQLGNPSLGDGIKADDVPLLAEVKRQLEQALSDVPSARTILDEAFRAGLSSGEESDLAWARVGSLLSGADRA